ncbi:hypothetical protein P692DRAFT_20639326, partial [Suillus brevipes Sb2]
MLIKVMRKMCMPSVMSWTHLYVHPLMEHLNVGSNEVVRVILPVKGACRIIEHS